jgi:hypothetical protein
MVIPDTKSIGINFKHINVHIHTIIPLQRYITAPSKINKYIIEHYLTHSLITRNYLNIMWLH